MREMVAFDEQPDGVLARAFQQVGIARKHARERSDPSSFRHRAASQHPFSTRGQIRLKCQFPL